MLLKTLIITVRCDSKDYKRVHEPLAHKRISNLVFSVCSEEKIKINTYNTQKISLGYFENNRDKSSPKMQLRVQITQNIMQPAAVVSKCTTSSRLLL